MSASSWALSGMRFTPSFSTAYVFESTMLAVPAQLLPTNMTLRNGAGAGVGLGAGVGFGAGAGLASAVPPVSVRPAMASAVTTPVAKRERRRIAPPHVVLTRDTRVVADPTSDVLRGDALAVDTASASPEN